MSIHEWLTLVGVLTSVVLSVTPWMFTVHSRLAVIANQVEQLCQKLEKLAAAHEQRLSMCIEHQARLDAYEAKLGDLVERVRELA